MKKALFRKLRQMSERVLGEEKTIDKEINKLLEETKPKTKKKKSDKK